MNQAVPFPHVAPPANPFQRIGFGILIVFLFVLISRVFDVVLTGLRVPLITSYLALAAAIFGGGIARVFNHRISYYLLAFTIWMGITVPFSFWRGGSIPVFRGWVAACFVYILVVSLVSSYQQCLRAMQMIALSVVTVALVALLTGDTTSGRLFTEGKFSNPNDLAQMMLIGLPFVYLLVNASGQNLLFRLPPLLLVLLVFYVLLKTGSRGSLLGLLVMAAYFFFNTTMKNRLVLVGVSAVVLLTAALVLPPALRTRYLHIFASESEVQPTGEDEEMLESADASAAARQEILQTSIAMTLRHPLFGVGPGMFSDVREEDAKRAGKRAIALVSHNAYTQVSSETGIPGFLFYTITLICCFRATGEVYKITKARRGPQWDAIGKTALCARLSLVAFAATSFFASVAYQSLFPMLAGLCAILHVTVKQLAGSEQLETGLAGRIAPFSPAARPRSSAVASSKTALRRISNR